MSTSATDALLRLSDADHVQLPAEIRSVAHAKLPATYEAAKTSKESITASDVMPCSAITRAPVIMVPIADIRIGIRRRGERGIETGLARLAESIESRGLIHPIRLQNGLELVAGHRRRDRAPIRRAAGVAMMAGSKATITATATATSNLTVLASAALGYARRLGWPVFPCHSIRAGHCSCGNPRCERPGKHPRTAHGLSDATTDAAIITAWWRRWPDASIGIRTGGGVWVLDIDDRHDGGATLAELERQHGALPTTPEVLTGGGGRHLYFTIPAGLHIPTRVGIARGIDVRAVGGYVIAPPSGHASGRGYAWECQHHPLEIPLAAPPAWLVAMVSKPAATAGPRAAPSIFTEGGRNHTLTRIAGGLRRHGVGGSALEDALLAINRLQCEPPLSDREVSMIARSIGRYAPATDRGAPSTDEFEALVMRTVTA